MNELDISAFARSSWAFFFSFFSFPSDNVNDFYSFRTAACQAAAGSTNGGLKVSGVRDTLAPWQQMTVDRLWPYSTSPQGS